MSSSVGPIIFDLMGMELDAEERELLAHPLIGGVIFFARNFDSPQQMAALCKDIRASRKQPILLTVDQEGGRVQRFQQGFTQLPSMSEIGSGFLQEPEKALAKAFSAGWVMAAELLQVGVDLSFAPVLDLDKGISNVIGTRAFHHDTAIVIALSKAFTQGMRQAGMASVGKHFPGHGSVAVDSHLGLPEDTRSFAEITTEDLIPFQEMIAAGMEGIMAAHIHFSQVDAKPVGFSAHWLQQVLRKQLQFTGMIFSDALDMHGADIAGSFPERVIAALEAGCDMALICNHREGVVKTLDALPTNYRPVDIEKLNKMQGKKNTIPTDLRSTSVWKKHISTLAEFF